MNPILYNLQLITCAVQGAVRWLSPRAIFDAIGKMNGRIGLEAGGRQWETGPGVFPAMVRCAVEQWYISGAFVGQKLGNNL